MRQQLRLIFDEPPQRCIICKEFYAFVLLFEELAVYFLFVVGYTLGNQRNHISKTRNRISKLGKYKNAISGVILKVVFRSINLNRIRI